MPAPAATPGSDRTRPAVIIDTSPTPNGDLHIGHLAGPFLGADIHARYLRARGRPVVFSTGTDDSQTYVAATARRLGTTPEALAAESHELIGRTLESAGISVDGYAPYDDAYRAGVLSFVGDLYDAGRLELRTVSFPCDDRTGEVLVEGMVSGLCPACVSRSSGGVCETCGHPNNFDELLDPWSVADPQAPIGTRRVQVLVLPMERYRRQLTAFYERRQSELRPRTLKFLRQALSRPLPDFPITYPIEHGLPSPFPGTEGQRLNAWVEGIPAAMYCTAYAAERVNSPYLTGKNLWEAEHDAEIVYFIGSDIVWFWCLTHLALLLAHEGRYALPTTIVSNEFYELEHDKFSTTRGHVVYIGELADVADRDAIRFHLALTNPEHQRTNFGREALVEVGRRDLIEPWNRLAGVLNALAAGRDRPLPVTEAGRARAAAVLDRFVDAYEPAAFSPSGAADIVVAQVARLLASAIRLGEAAPEAVRPELGDLFLEVRTVLAGASPILIHLAERVRAAGGWDGTLDHALVEVTEVSPFRVPSFGAGAGAGAGRAV